MVAGSLSAAISSFVTALSLTVAFGGGALADEGPVELDREQVEQVEDWTEALANQLHELSVAVRDRNAAGIAAHFS